MADRNHLQSDEFPRQGIRAAGAGSKKTFSPPAYGMQSDVGAFSFE